VVTAEETDFLREHLGAGGGEICLDVACGTGRFGPVIAGTGHRPVGFDVSAGQLEPGEGRLTFTPGYGNVGWAS
jgi:ubiquinone/menaquinone biosynthesis C-methylase UbiE